MKMKFLFRGIDGLFNPLEKHIIIESVDNASQVLTISDGKWSARFTFLAFNNLLKMGRFEFVGTE